MKSVELDVATVSPRSIGGEIDALVAMLKLDYSSVGKSIMVIISRAKLIPRQAICGPVLHKEIAGHVVRTWRGTASYLAASHCRKNVKCWRPIGERRIAGNDVR